jgi:hypothetical protein
MTEPRVVLVTESKVARESTVPLIRLYEHIAEATPASAPARKGAIYTSCNAPSVCAYGLGVRVRIKVKSR